MYVPGIPGTRGALEGAGASYVITSLVVDGIIGGIQVLFGTFTDVCLVCYVVFLGLRIYEPRCFVGRLPSFLVYQVSLLFTSYLLWLWCSWRSFYSY